MASEQAFVHTKLKATTTQLFSNTLVRLYVSVVILWGYTSSKVFSSSWAGDDWPNSQTPYWVKWRFGELSVKSVWNEAMYWNNEWMNGQGRFYPLQWIESRFAFSYLRELWQYKLLETSVLLISGLLLAYLIFLISDSHEITLLLLLFLSVTVQFRRDFDPHLGYAFLVPSLLVKVLSAAILLFYSVKSTSIKLKCVLSITAGVLYFGAMSTYEYAFLLFPLLGITLIASIHKKFNSLASKGSPKNVVKRYLAQSWVFLPILIAWIAYSILVFGVLRKNATAISGNYTLGISWNSLPVFFKQIFLPLPLNNFDSKVDLKYFENPINSIFLLLITFVFFTIYYRNFIQRYYLSPIQNKDKKDWKEQDTPIFGFLFGFFMLLSVGFMLSLQPVWWGRADTRHGYLGVLIQEFGMSIILSYLIKHYLSGIKPHQRHQKRGLRK